MITQLTINNFAIVEQLSIEFSPGMTAVTGETGAGKSIAIDALSLCLGARADASMVRYGTKRADIAAHFVLGEATIAELWLKDHRFDEGNECILRRIINQDGRSKAFINNHLVPISQLREIGRKLIQIHGQHAHQLLLKSDHQHTLLNHYMAEYSMLTEMKAAYYNWKSACNALNHYEKQHHEDNANLSLLQYQLKELDEFAPIQGEFEKIDEEYKRLANSEQLISLTQQAVVLLAEHHEYNVVNLLNKATQTLKDLVGLDSSLNNVLTMLSDASIQISEASYELSHYADNIDIDPLRIIQLEERIAKQTMLARKYGVPPETLPDFYQKKLTEYATYEKLDERSGQLRQQIDKYYQHARLLAKKLHDKRQSAAKKLSELITQRMHELAMPAGKFTIAIDYNESLLREDGANTVTFLATTNSGQPLQPIAKVASGGELSRLALAIQVLVARKKAMPVLIFDEIDSGISGATAAKVGNLLRELGLSTQVVTITHLPQVAGNAHEHFFVAKSDDKQQTTTVIKKLTTRERIVELARLLAGDKITDNTLASAKDLLVI